MPPRSVSDTELAVLKALWTTAPATVREVREALHEAGRSWAYTTVQTLLTRLAQKGYVASDRRGRAHVYRPAVTREDFLGEHLDDLARRVCEGQTVPLVLSLVKSSRLQPKDIRRFRELLATLEQQASRDEDEAEDADAVRRTDAGTSNDPEADG